MPFALLIIGLAVIVAGARGKSSDLITLVEEDFLSSQGYIPWAISILAIGAVGYIPRAKPISDAFLVLIVVVLILSNKGFFSNLQSAVVGIGGQTLAGASQSGATASTPSSASASASGLSSSVTGLISPLQTQFGSGGAASGASGSQTQGGSAANAGVGDINVSSNPAADNYADAIAAGASAP